MRTFVPKGSKKGLAGLSDLIVKEIADGTLVTTTSAPRPADEVKDAVAESLAS